MITFTALALLLLLGLAALGLLGLGRVVRADGSRDVWGRTSRPPAGGLPRSHEDPFDPARYRTG